MQSGTQGRDAYPCGVPDTTLVDPLAVRQVRSWVRDALVLEAGAAPAAAPSTTLVPDAALVEAVRRHRVAEVLAPHVSRLGVPPRVAEAVEHFRVGGRRAQTVQVLEIGRVHGILAERGIDVLVIKGPALAVLSAGDASARGPGDIDLLVAPHDVLRAHDVLVDHGWSLRAGTAVEPGTWAWRHAVRSDNAFTFDGRGSSIDLHWRLDPTLDALPGFTEVWGRREPVDLGHGVVVPTLGRHDVLGHACLHSAKDSWRWLRALVDVHRLAGRPESWDRDWREQPLRRLEASTLAVTRGTLGLPPGVPSDVLTRLDRVSPSVLRRAVAAQERPVEPAHPFPGAETLRRLRYLAEASTTPRDLAYSPVALALPVQTVVGIEARSAWAGVPVTLWRRVLRVGRRLAAWARR